MPTIEEAVSANRPRNEVKKVYLPGTPGAARKAARITLTELKRAIKAQGGRAKARREGLMQ